MLEFAKFAKSYQSSRKVEDAYQAYLSGARLVTNKEQSLYQKIRRSNVIYLNGFTVKDRYKTAEINVSISTLTENKNVFIKSWDEKSKVLTLKTK